MTRLSEVWGTKKETKSARRSSFTSDRYHLDEAILVRKCFTLSSAIGDIHPEIWQHMCGVLNEISQVLQAFNTVTVAHAICVLV